MNTATLIADKLKGFAGHARLYRLTPALEVNGKLHDLVVVSATIIPTTGIETYIFPADSSGRVTDWEELPGSTSGTLSHEEALRNAGYGNFV